MHASLKTPWHLWAVGLTTLAWNGFRGWSYIMARTADIEATDPPNEALVYLSEFPLWADSAWALGVWGAVLGSILLLFRSRWAAPAFLASLVGLAGITVYQRLLSDLPEGMSGVGFLLLTWATTLFGLWYARTMRSKGVLR